MSTFTDYYELLGVPVDASTEVIRSAFKKLALQYHPDIYKGEDAQERMRILLLAYKTLSNVQERKSYDLRRSEHFLDVARPPMTQGSYRPPTVSAPSSKRPASPGARRDRQRRYAFPDLRASQSVRIDLVDYTYQLIPEETELLLERGILRGVAMPVPYQQAWYCHRCRHHWEHEGETPHSCPNCYASDWAQYLLLRCVHCCAIFESEQIRYEIGSLHYGTGALCPPYELFPLCPYCGNAHWCPAEDIRVDEMRVRLASRAARLKMTWIIVAVGALFILGSVAIAVLH